MRSQHKGLYGPRINRFNRVNIDILWISLGRIESNKMLMLMMCALKKVSHTALVRLRDLGDI